MNVIDDIERPHSDAGSLAATVEHHWPKIRAVIDEAKKLADIKTNATAPLRKALDGLEL